MPLPAQELGRVVANKYRLERLIGAGGMGRVYEAENTWTGLRVAVKLLHPQYASDPDYVERFKREARSASRIAHPNTVTVLDLGETDEGGLFMVQELLLGTPLNEVIESEGELEVSRVVDLFEQVTDALAAAHEAGVFHRDVKPANIVLTYDRRGAEVPKVVDFGLAKLTTASTMTPSGVVLGSPAYLAPEQITHGRSDARSDQWAIGVCLFEALTGELPFQGDTLPLLASQILAAEIPAPPASLPPDLVAAIRKAMSRDPDERFATMAAFRDALGAMLPSVSAPDNPWAPDTHPTFAEESTVVDHDILERVNRWQIDQRRSLVTTARAHKLGTAKVTIGHASGVGGLDATVLAQALSDRLGLVCRLLRYLTYGDLNEAFTRGEIELAMLPPVAYLRIARVDGVRLLAAPERVRTSHVSALIARASDPNPLRGEQRTAGWVDPLSAAGYRVPRRLAEGLLEGRVELGEERFLGSHDAVVAAVAGGTVDVGGCGCVVDREGDLVAGSLRSAEGIRILARSKPLPEIALCAGPALQQTRERQLRAWIGSDEMVREVVQPLGYDAIAPEQDGLYASLVDMLR